MRRMGPMGQMRPVGQVRQMNWAEFANSHRRIGVRIWLCPIRPIGPIGPIRPIHTLIATISHY